MWQLTQCCKIKKHLLRFAFAFSVVATITSFTSCTDDDTEEIDKVNNRTHFNPPDWIQGKWVLGIIEDDHHLIEFRTNNFLEVSPEIHLEKDYNTYINQKIIEFNQNVIVTETTISETVYQYNIDYSPGDDRKDKVIYKFTKKNNNTTQLQFLHEDGVDWATITMPRYTR